MFEILPQGHDNLLGIRVNGKLTRADYDRLVPVIEQHIHDHGPLRVLFLMEDWHGWDSLTALWDDARMDAHFNADVERLAMVGETDWQRWITTLSAPFADGQLRYFDRARLDEAWAWLREGRAA